MRPYVPVVASQPGLEQLFNFGVPFLGSVFDPESAVKNVITQLFVITFLTADMVPYSGPGSGVK